MASLLASTTMIFHHGEDGAEINDARDFIYRAAEAVVVQKYGRLYTLQIVRWLASLLAELSHYGAYTKRIESLLGLNEPFELFRTEDSYLRDRKTWSIYR